MYYVWSNFQPYITVLTDTEAKILSLRHNMLALRPQPSPLLAGTSFSDRSFRRLFQRRKVNSTSRCAALPVAAVAREVDDFTKYSGYVFELNSADEESLTEYNIAKIAAFYQKKPLIVVRRLVQIGSTLGKWFAVRYMDIVNERADEMFKVSINYIGTYFRIMHLRYVYLN